MTRQIDAARLPAGTAEQFPDRIVAEEYALIGTSKQVRNGRRHFRLNDKGLSENLSNEHNPHRSTSSQWDHC